MTAYSINSTDKDHVYGWEAIKPTRHINPIVAECETAIQLAQMNLDILETRRERGAIDDAEYFKGIDENLDAQLKAKTWRDEVMAREREWAEQQIDERPF